MFFWDKKTKIVSAAFAKWLVVGVTLILMEASGTKTNINGYM